MGIEPLIESIGLSAADLKHYLLREIDEFLAADSPVDEDEEFGDVLFALRAMSWAHAGRHLALDPSAFEAKVRSRLRRYATLTRHPLRFLHDRIPELKFGVVHFAPGQFSGQWTEFDSLKNGTVAEIHLLTEAPFGRREARTNHCIVTFDDNETLEYSIIEGAPDTEAGNVVLCKIPDFLFKHAKRRASFAELSDYMSLQVLAALDGLQFRPDAIAHGYSWECGFLTDSTEARARLESFKTIFSPGLTVGRLESDIDLATKRGGTMTPAEMTVAADYERKLCSWAGKVVVESTADRRFYSDWVSEGALDVRSFAQVSSAVFATDPEDNACLSFISGGRPVREKGLLELCGQFARVRDWARGQRVKVSLAILCRERRPEKGAAYIEELEQVVLDQDLADIVTIEPRVSLDQLRRRIREATAVIVPSLFDPFCLLPTYAVEAEKPAFLSCHAGVSENVRSRDFIFDPRADGDLARAIAAWHRERRRFEYQALFPSYRDLYLEAGGSE